MPSPTMTLIQSVTVPSGGSASIDFTSIPSTYTDLCLKVSARTNRTTYIPDSLFIKLNGSTTSFTGRLLFGEGNAGGQSAASTTSTNPLENYGSAVSNVGTASTFGTAEYYIPNYAGSTNKSASSDAAAESNGTLYNLGFAASLWSNTAAVSSISIVSGYGTLLQQFSTAYLYGIKNS